MDAAEDDVVGLGVLGGLLGELERVAAEIGELNDVVALVMVTEDQEAVAQLGSRRADALAQFVARELQVFLWDFGLPVAQVRLGDEWDGGDVGLAGFVGQVGRENLWDEVGLDDGGFSHVGLSDRLLSVRLTLSISNSVANLDGGCQERVLRNVEQWRLDITKAVAGFQLRLVNR